jgi:glycosyltransferase involved in cell wall biosynthesis
MQASHVLCLPSVRESGGAVLLEAMTTCRLVIAVAHGGPAELVDRENGCPIPAQDPDQVVRDLQVALLDILSSPHCRMERGCRGRERVEQIFDWGRKITAAEQLYGKLFPPRLDRAA